MVESAPLTLADAAATHAQGRRLADALRAIRPDSLILFLEGELGAGKTTLARGFLEALGHRGRVPSPTYTLIEPYELAGYRVYHVDLFRIRQARELGELDLAEQLGTGAIALIEWPDHGAGYLPDADIRLRLDILPQGRALTCEGVSETGRAVLTKWASVGASSMNSTS